MLDPDIVRREDTGTGTIVELRGAENVARNPARLAGLAAPQAARGHTTTTASSLPARCS